jgi:hypothetical protein
MTNEQQKIDVLEQTFRRNSGFFLKQAANNKELYLAMGDEEKAAKEQLKIETMETAWRALERAKGEKTLEEVKQYFLEWLETYKQDLQKSVEEARAKDDGEALIHAYIRSNVSLGPIPGFFSFACKQAFKVAEVKHG